MYQLTITDPGNLLSIVLRTEITSAQSDSILALLGRTPRHNGSIIGANAAGPSGSVFTAIYPKRERLTGIAQYQAESR